MDKKVLVYIQEKELAPHGGPVAVCYYYNEEQKNAVNMSSLFFMIYVHMSRCMKKRVNTCHGCQNL